MGHGQQASLSDHVDPLADSPTPLQVTRNRNKWKCTMTHGIVHIDGREYVFSKWRVSFLAGLGALHAHRAELVGGTSATLPGMGAAIHLAVYKSYDAL